MLERFRSWYEEKSISVAVYLSVQAMRPTRPLDFDKRIQAVTQFSELPEAIDLAAANKRVANILAKLESPIVSSTLDTTLLSEPAEITLANSVMDLNQLLQPLFEQGNYTEAMLQLASLKDQINQFFDDVMVNVDNAAIRNNRLALLSNLRMLFLGTADISLL